MNGTRKQYDRPSAAEVLRLVRAFLDSPPRTSPDGGFAEVLGGDERELNTIIEALIKYRYEPDADGDRPMLWALCDWTRQEKPRFLTLPQEDSAARLLLAQINVSIAADTLRTVVQEMQVAAAKLTTPLDSLPDPK